jgi:two-component system phosphate regulon response regulator PhoB
MEPGSTGDLDPLVVVIDPDESVLRLMSIKLRRAGFRVAVATEVEQGLQATSHEAPALVILDGTLPGTGARKVVEQAADRWGNRRPAFVCLSPLHDPRDVEEALRSGCDDYVTKPFSPAELVHRVRVTLLRRALQRTMPGVEAAQSGTS